MVRVSVNGFKRDPSPPAKIMPNTPAMCCSPFFYNI
ncbi:Uncharacterised protein [Vibrio cholerae]|nr:Uncharacterised protein [Vibrio cholerae]